MGNPAEALKGKFLQLPGEGTGFSFESHLRPINTQDAASFARVALIDIRSGGAANIYAAMAWITAALKEGKPLEEGLSQLNPLAIEAIETLHTSNFFSPYSAYTGS